MTKEEAIIVLKYGMKYRNPKNDTEKDRNEALDMAISALSENKAEDRPKNGERFSCPNCGFKADWFIPSKENNTKESK